MGRVLFFFLFTHTGVIGDKPDRYLIFSQWLLKKIAWELCVIGRVCYMKIQNFSLSTSNLHFFYSSQCISLHESIWGYKNANILKYKAKRLMLFDKTVEWWYIWKEWTLRRSYKLLGKYGRLHASDIAAS